MSTSWWYNTHSGELSQENGVENFVSSINFLNDPTGWHKLNIPGSDSEVQAAADAKKEFPTGATPTTSVVQGAAQAAVGSTSILGLGQIGDFFGRLDEANLWIRVGEVVLGLILAAVGLARLTHAVPAATQVAKTVGAVAA